MYVCFCPQPPFQIASALPKTAYLKLIDVWFIFCILSDFVMVFVLVVINCYVEAPSPLPPLQPRKSVTPISSSTSITTTSITSSTSLSFLANNHREKKHSFSPTMKKVCQVVSTPAFPT